MHALTGAWIANVERSRRDPNHQFQQATIRFDITGSAVSLTYGGVNASGRQEHGGQTLEADGQEHALAEAPGVFAITILEPRVLRTVAIRNDTVLGRATYEVSEDGRTLTAAVSGLDAAGKSFDQVIIFDRE
jgi:hypothetical protein